MPLDDLVYRERPAAGEPAGALVLMHGRGVDENDLFPLLDVLDPDRRLAGFTPRAPLRPPGHTGNHWYVVPRVGFPDSGTFWQSYRTLEGWLEAIAEHTGLGQDRIALGGFSQGTVMAYALGLGVGRPRPAAILAMSGFIPTVDGWEPDLADRTGLPVYVSHGTADPIMSIEFARAARDLLEGTMDLTYGETPMGHGIDPRTLDEARDWLRAAV